jgi:hypothetical protein
MMKEEHPATHPHKVLTAISTSTSVRPRGSIGPDKGGKLKTGRHVRYPKGTPLTNLYLRMLEMTGTPMEKLGDSTGKLNMLSV